MEGRVITLVCLAFVFDFGLSEPMFMERDSSRCFIPKVDLKALKPGIHTHRPSKSRSQSSTLQQMKFEVVYDESVTNSSISDFIMNITQETVDLISRQLQVKEESQDIIFDRQCQTGSYVNNGTVVNCTCADVTYCGTATLPEHHLEPCYTCKRYENGTEYDCEPEPGGPAERGVSDVHFILYVTSVVCPDGVIGFANACFLDLTLNRPNAGFINICPGATTIREDLQSTVQHEIYHAIGISPSLYALFRDENGDPLTPLGDDGYPIESSSVGYWQWSDRVARTKTLDWDIRGGEIERNVTIMVTPNLIREAREYYGCDTIEGVELEDDYGRFPSVSALAHFESRVMPTESMGPAFSKGRRFSRFTLAFLEDTGWYKANYDLADPFIWGRDLGCGFVNKSCKWWMDTQRNRGLSLRPYCENPRELLCGVEGNAALCTNIKHDEPLPEQYQYFDSLPGFNDTELASVGGVRMLEDHCPVIFPYERFQTNDYRRQTCDRDIKECDSDPCNNGATCSDIITGYFCTCTAEYAGRHCDYSKTICSTSDQCAKNEVCKDGLCSCGHGRIRTEEGCQIPRRFNMWFQITEVNGSLGIYPDPKTFKSSDEIIRGELEYAIFHRLSRWEVFVDSVFSVKIKSFNGSLGMEIDIVLDAGSTPDDVMIYDLMTDDYFFTAEDLSSGYTSYTVNVSSIVVQDLDECDEMEYSACSVYSTCNNTIGSYQCSCLPGFGDRGNPTDGQGTVCIDIDECSNSSLNECSLFARCTNTIGGYNCVCLSGYVESTGSSGRLCADINECISKPCFNGGTCRNFKDRFTCACAPGYEGQNCEIDQNECISAELNDCSPVAACTDEPGTFSCACPPEYTDISPTGAGPGRVCENGSMTTIVIISIVGGVMFVLFVALLLLSQAKTKF